MASDLLLARCPLPWEPSLAVDLIEDVHSRCGSGLQLNMRFTAQHARQCVVLLPQPLAALCGSGLQLNMRASAHLTYALVRR